MPSGSNHLPARCGKLSPVCERVAIGFARALSADELAPISLGGYRPPAEETIVMPSWPSGSAWPGIQPGGKTGSALTFGLDRSVRAGRACILVT